MKPPACTTETIGSCWQGMDQWSAAELAARLCTAQWQSLDCFSTGAGSAVLATAGEAAVERLQGTSGRLIYCGAGSAGAQACLDGLELPGTFGWPQHRLVLLLAGGWDSFLDFGGAAEDDADAACRSVDALNLTPHDVLMAVSASGSTAYTLAAAERAGQAGALVIGLCNNAGSPLEQQANHCIVLLTGAEAVVGSTRMAAGTAQKIALNALSTLIMARLGYLYDNLMVRMQVSNRKLVGRAARMVACLCDCHEDEALHWLALSDYQVPVAVLMHRGVGKEHAGAASRLSADSPGAQCLRLVFKVFNE